MCIDKMAIKDRNFFIERDGEGEDRPVEALE